MRCMAEREEARRAVQVVRLVVDAAHGQGRRAYRRRHQPTVPGTSEKRLDCGNIEHM